MDREISHPVNHAQGTKCDMRNRKRRIHLKLMGTPTKVRGFTEAVGLRLRAAREALGKNQTQLADAINAAKNTYSQWESGDRLANLVAMAKLCNDYGITLDWIYRGVASGLPQDLHEKVLKRHHDLTKPRTVSNKRAG